MFRLMQIAHHEYTFVNVFGQPVQLPLKARPVEADPLQSPSIESISQTIAQLQSENSNEVQQAASGLAGMFSELIQSNPTFRQMTHSFMDSMSRIVDESTNGSGETDEDDDRQANPMHAYIRACMAFGRGDATSETVHSLTSALQQIASQFTNENHTEEGAVYGPSPAS